MATGMAGAFDTAFIDAIAEAVKPQMIKVPRRSSRRDLPAVDSEFAPTATARHGLTGALTAVRSAENAGLLLR